MSHLEDLKAAIADLEDEIEHFELDNDDYVEQFENMLDESNTVIIEGIVYTPSWVLKQIDEPAYDQGLNNYVDSMDKENDPKYQELVEELEDLQDQLDEETE